VLVTDLGYRLAIHQAAEALRSMPDGELVRLAMAAQESQPTAPAPTPTVAIRAERPTSRAREPKVKAKVDKAPANPPEMSAGAQRAKTFLERRESVRTRELREASRTSSHGWKKLLAELSPMAPLGCSSARG